MAKQLKTFVAPLAAERERMGGENANYNGECLEVQRQNERNSQIRLRPESGVQVCICVFVCACY